MSKRGKSHFTEWLIRFMFAHPDPRRRWRFGLVFAGSLYSHAYDWLPEESRIEGYDEKRLEVYLERLKAFSRAGKTLPQSFVWFDDLMGVLPLESKVFMQLITTGRHLGVNVIICAQYIGKGVSTTLRVQASHALMWGTEHGDSLEYLHSSFGQLFRPEDVRERSKRKSLALFSNYACVCYSERHRTLRENHAVVRAPARLPKGPLKFEGEKTAEGEQTR
jgi:hypothetical protein